MKWSILPLSLSLLGQAVNALSPAEWRSQSIYFLLTDRFGRDDSSTSAPCDVNQRIYCGGTWQGIINQLDYIQGMGFTAIWITPVTEQFYESTGDGSSYHGYWQQNIYEVNRKHGTKQNLKSLADALHARGMYLMVDVVANHMGYRGAGNNVNYNVMNPFNRAEHYNNFCTITDYNNQNSVEKCWLGSNTVSLPDLATTHPWVRSTWNDWVRDLVKDYSIDGLRIDTVKHVEKDFWRPYNDAAGVYCVGEIFSGDPGYTCDYQNYMDGVLNYPIYYPLLNAFKSTSGSMSELRNMIGTVSNKCRDPTLLGNFIENHDNPRFGHYTRDVSQAKNVLTFMFLTDGIPIVYAGQEQHYGGGEDPANREATWLSGYSRNSELYKWIATTNKIRSLAVSKDSGFVTARNNPFYHDTTTLAMRKGSRDGQQLITIVSNKGANGDGYTMQLTGHGYGSGATVMELYTCTPLTVNNGVISVPMASGQPRALVPSSWVAGSGLCGSTGPSPITTTAGGPDPTCAIASSLSIQFQHLVTTNYGDNVYIIGSIPQLGSWNVANAVLLSAEKYTTSNPEWRTTITLPVGTNFEYKFIKKMSNGQVLWESDPNRTFNVPSKCAGTIVTASASWK